MKTIIALILFSALSLFAEDIYLAQSNQGNGNGSSAGNARAFSWFNNSANWSTVAGNDGKIGPGDTVHIVGVINLTGTSATADNQLRFQGGGIPGNPITLKFENGGRLRHPTGFPTGLLTASGSGIHDVVVEGASSAPIKGGTTQIDLEVFDNGTKLGNQVDGNRIVFFDNCGSNITLKNLYCYGAYVREYASASDPHASGNIITFKGRHNLLVDNCKVEHGEGGIGVTGIGPGENNNLAIINSVVYATSTAIKMGVNSGAVNNGVTISNNRLDGFGFWSGRASPNQHHCDGIQTITAGSNQEQKNLTVAYNEIGPDLGLYGSMNAHIFLEDNVHGLYVYNNLLTAQSTPLNPLQSNRPPGTANAFITAGSYPSQFDSPSGIRSLIANNTILGAGSGQGISTSFATVNGNIVQNLGSMMNIWENKADSPTHGKYVISDKNVYYNPNGQYQFGVSSGPGQGIYNNFNSWKNPPSGIQGWDQNSITANPKAAFPTGVLASDSPAIGFAPTQSKFSNDLARNVRSVPWDAGALEYGGTPGPTPSPTATPTPAPTATPAPSPTPPAPVLSFALVWNVVPNATLYIVYENNVKIAEEMDTFYSLEGKVGPKTYTVSAKNSSGEGPRSNQVTLPEAPSPTPTPAPTATPVPTPVAPVLELRQQ